VDIVAVVAVVHDDVVLVGVMQHVSFVVVVEEEEVQERLVDVVEVYDVIVNVVWVKLFDTVLFVVVAAAAAAAVPEAEAEAVVVFVLDMMVMLY
jgi:hypothetical protein